MLTVLPLFTF